MSDSKPTKERLIWRDTYSVGVQEIDDQHKQLFVIMNNLLDVIESTPKEDAIRAVIRDLLAYKTAHFALEHAYFHQFNYEGARAHEAAHAWFDQRIREIEDTHRHDAVAHAFALIDFLEDWLIGHIMDTDQQYVACFREHGLR